LYRDQLILIIGSFIALIAGVFSAFLPGLAYITVSAEWGRFLLPDAPHIVVYLPLIFSIHDLTLKLLVSAIGGLLGLCSFCEHKTTVPCLSFAGISLGTIGFLLPYGATQIGANEYSIDVPWIGSLITLVGVLLMFLGYTLRNSNVPKSALAVIPILLIVYLMSPILIFTGNLWFFVFMQANLSMSTIMGILILLGHLVIIWAGIAALRFPEREISKSQSK
jgi:hypothetical protein